MTDAPRKPYWKRMRCIAVVMLWLVLAPAGYMSAYLMSMSPGMTTYWDGGKGTVSQEIKPSYKPAELGPVFAPAHAIDRAIRPSLWRTRHYRVP